MSFFIAHVIPYVGRNFGGPVIAMTAMVDGLAAKGHQVAVYAVHRAGEGAPVAVSPAVEKILCQDVRLGALRYSSNLRSALEQSNISLIHSHGLWTDVHRRAAVAAAKKRIPHVIGPCGMLDQDALSRSRWKKILAKACFQDQALASADCLLANSEKEYADIRQYGLKNPVAVIPNPVPGPLKDEGFRCDGLFNRYPELDMRKKVLFLGRLHPVKGLERLINAWAMLTAFHEKWQLLLAGPDENGYLSIIERQIARLNCRSSIYPIGAIDQNVKWEVLRESDLLVMPSDFENFGMSAAEAMLVGKPVIATKGTPWEILSEISAGWWVERNCQAIACALGDAMRLTDSERRKMGLRGKLLAEQFLPEKVVDRLSILYKWLSGQGNRPDFVRTL